MDLRLLTFLLPAALGQIQPDVRFDDQNDRFDLTTLMRQTAFEQWGDVADGSRRADGIISPDNIDTKITNATAKFMEALRTFQLNFQYNTTKHSSEESDDPNEKLHLRRDLATYLYSNRPDLDTRRSGQTEAEADREVLIQHAVPIMMEVEGVMQMPIHGE